MAWPQSFSIATGIGINAFLPTLIAWGTTGIITGVIVKSIRSTPMVEEVKVEQGGGLTATQIIINDGDEVEVTVDDDRNITWPLTGQTTAILNVINPQPNGASLSAPELFMTVNNNYNVSAKSVGERTILMKKYILITPTNM